MSDRSIAEPCVVEWGWAGSALDGQSGDLHVVAPFPGGALVALIDGLGHGPEAAAAAQAAVPALTVHAGEPVAAVMRCCHDSLRKTRGAVMSLASFDSRIGSMAGLGVGNVDGLLVRGRCSLERLDAAIAVRPGVVGFQLPSLHTNTFRVSPGDTLILVTDGIRSAFASGLMLDDQPQEIAESILARFATGSDDAHVVVARYVGLAP